jgi:hypothetical protein
MEESNQLPPSARRSLAIGAYGGRRSTWERALDLWFAPKRFESTALYERIGVLLIKRYVPTGGDVVSRRYGVRIADIRGSLDSLMRFERLTRRLEAIHELAFLGFAGWSLWRALTHQSTLLDLGIAIVVYLVLILSPAMLQRYNRLRVYPVIRRMMVSQMHAQQDDTDHPGPTAAAAVPQGGRDGAEPWITGRRGRRRNHERRRARCRVSALGQQGSARGTNLARYAPSDRRRLRLVGAVAMPRGGR